MYEGHCKVTESNLAIGLALIDVDVQLLVYPIGDVIHF